MNGTSGSNGMNGVNGSNGMSATVQPEAPSAVASPIADLTYRNYDGPLRNRAVRWWIVALATLRMVAKKPGFWIVCGIGLLPYLFHGLLLYIVQNRLAAGMGSMLNVQPSGQKWAFVIYQSLNGDLNAICLFLIALIAGSGSIASDNRANALLVYLSKPITKGDYLLGKWMGVFLAVFSVALIPTLLLWTFMALTYSSDGFFKDDPWLLPHLVLAALLPAVIHTSLILGFSAWSKSAGMAGATYAAVFFLGNAVMGNLISGVVAQSDPQQGILVQHLSIGGVIDGLAQNILHITDVDALRIYATFKPHFDGPPAPGPVAALAIALVIMGVAAARAKIRAVEVIKG